jgi:hypothetical protein
MTVRMKPPRRFVRRLWQLAHTTSHFSISAKTAFQGAHASTDAELFFSQVIELQYERVALPAIDARMLAKKRSEIGGALGNDPFRAAAGRIDVALLVARVVLVLVRGPTGSAVVVALTV